MIPPVCAEDRPSRQRRATRQHGARRFPYPQTVRRLARALRLPAADRARLEAALPRRAATQPAPPAPPPPTNLPEPPTSFVGRDRELASLRAALDGALAGRGALVLIGGEVAHRCRCPAAARRTCAR